MQRAPRAIDALVDPRRARSPGTWAAFAFLAVLLVAAYLVTDRWSWSLLAPMGVGVLAASASIVGVRAATVLAMLLVGLLLGVGWVLHATGSGWVGMLLGTALVAVLALMASVVVKLRRSRHGPGA